jgi:uncharacterized lipoprotein YmbA
MTAACSVLAALASCGSSPPINFYTLQQPDGVAGQGGSRGASQNGAAPYMFELAPVSVPAQADQPQIMLRTGQGAVTPLYSDRWAAPLSNEIQAALSDALQRRLGVPDVDVVKPPAGTPVWHVQVDVQRFDNAVGGPALLDATWRIRPTDLAGTGLLCRSVVRTPASGEGVAALVHAQQDGLQALGAAIAVAIQAGGRSPDAAALGPNVDLLGCNQFTVDRPPMAAAAGRPAR